jgi:hypothetical protein
MPLSPLGERVARDGVFISRRGPCEGVPAGPLIVNNSKERTDPTNPAIPIVVPPA